MPIRMAGIDHTLAGLDIRSRFSFTRTRMEHMYASVLRQSGILGSVLISTCNRFELWLDLAEGTDISPIALLCVESGLRPDELTPYFVCREGDKAVEHLFRVASGLESRILGEDQIITQVNNALALARRSGAASAMLEVLFRRAVTAGKRVRTETRLSASDRSVAHTALRLFSAQGMQLKGASCMVIGSGMMGKATAQALLSYGANVSVTVRKYKNGIADLPAECRLIPYEDRHSYLPRCDLVVSATRCTGYTLRSAELSALEPGHTIRLIDLAVPRDIDPAVKQLPWAELYDIDSFGIDPATEQIRRETEKAEAILAEERAVFYRWQRGHDCAPQVSAAARLAVRDALRRTDELTPEAAGAVERMMAHMLFGMKDRLDSRQLELCLTAVTDSLSEWRHN